MSVPGATRLAAMSLLVMMSAVVASAQITSGTVTGTVRDAQGAGVPGATITLQSQTRATPLAPVVTNAEGDFVVPNVAPDTYTVEVSMPGFKTLQRTGVPVSGGDRVALGQLTVEVGGLAETVTVTSDKAIIQAQSGERSFTVTTNEVQNLPLSNRNFASVTQLTPGVTGTTTRLGGGGQNNITMDGISVMDTGSNGQMLQLNVDAIAEVKVLTSNYQAEYGRSSGLQIMAVTKSGTNQFRGSLYDILRNSDWNSNSWANELNGVAKPELKEQDLGYSIGGPVGRPGGTNKLFFFYSHEYRPRSTGGTVTRFRVPTALERAGDFSQTRDNTGAVFNLIRDYTTGLPCSATDRRGCFQADGVLGRIPADRLYAPGTSILNLWPLPNVEQTPGRNYNLELTAPRQKILQAHQVALRGDYQLRPTLRLTTKFNGQDSAPGLPVIAGTMPGYNDMQRVGGTTWVSTWATTLNYILGPTTFIEGTYGEARNYLTNTPVNDASNINNVGLAGLPLLYPDARIVPTETFAYEALSKSNAPWFQDGRILLPPNFVWGQRVGCTPSILLAGGVAAPCPPNLSYPGAINTNRTRDFSASITRVAGRHTFKAGYYHNNSLKSQNINVGLGALPFQSEMNFGNDPNNPLDSGFGYANAALGILSTYTQQSKFVEGNFVYNNREFYIQDNWKASSRLTLDYGLRIVNQQPQHDKFLNSSNFSIDRWAPGAAPALYAPGCATGSYPCAAADRRAVDPRTNQTLGPGSAIYIGQLVPNTGDLTQGLAQAGQGISDYAYSWPTLVVAPRFGAAYDLTGNQGLVIRGGAGMFFDRPDGNTVQNMVSNPPHSRGVTIRSLSLADLAGAAAGPIPAASLFSYRDGDALPTSVQWNVGMQMRLPWSSVLDVSYVGQHAYNQLFGTGFSAAGININSVDIGAAFLPQNQDPTLAASATPGATALTTDLLRAMRGYSVVNQQLGMFQRTYHSIQSAYTRRFNHGFSAGLNWTLSLSDNGTVGLVPRFQHNADGTYILRDDWDEYVDLNKNQGLIRHVVKGNFVWDLPDLRRGEGVARRVAAAVANDWQVSGILTADSGTPYTVNFSYQSGGSNVNLTGSPDYPATVRIVGDPGSGCSDNQYRQFNTDAFAGPLSPSVGLESERNYMTGCGQRLVDLAIARLFRFGGSRTAQVRIEAFNAFDTVIYSARSAAVQFRSQADQTVVNNQFNADGSVNEGRVLPNNAGFGAATAALPLRTVQLQLRFSF
jgi:Carboxypeptidase regulatory-like domain